MQECGFCSFEPQTQVAGPAKLRCRPKLWRHCPWHSKRFSSRASRLTHDMHGSSQSNCLQMFAWWKCMKMHVFYFDCSHSGTTWNNGTWLNWIQAQIPPCATWWRTRHFESFWQVTNQVTNQVTTFQSSLRRCDYVDRDVSWCRSMLVLQLQQQRLRWFSAKRDRPRT